MKNEFLFVGNFARTATTQLVFVLIGIVVAVSLFLNPRIEKSSNKPKRPDLFTAITDEIKIRFRLFYQSFETVMGAQIRISAINTLLTTIFVLAVSLKYKTFVIGLTFLCGLLPIVGNVISNAIIVGIAITMSPRLAIIALIFLIAIHKLEYFLNSKIIGDLIKNPVWLTLLALIIGERIMGIPGMILAPVVLNYIKVEASQVAAAGCRTCRQARLTYGLPFVSVRTGTICGGTVPQRAVRHARRDPSHQRDLQAFPLTGSLRNKF